MTHALTVTAQHRPPETKISRRLFFATKQTPRATAALSPFRPADIFRAEPRVHCGARHGCPARHAGRPPPRTVCRFRTRSLYIPRRLAHRSRYPSAPHSYASMDHHARASIAPPGAAAAADDIDVALLLEPKLEDDDPLQLSLPAPSCVDMPILQAPLPSQGFRKVHADRWEFAHEGFLRHSKHLLKKIVRRRSSPTQQSSLQPGSSGEPSMDTELHTLRRERSALLREVAKLKHEHLETVERMSTLNQRLESAEDRQKQMVSFLAKLLQNPTFLRQLKLHRQQKEIDSTRAKRKFIKHVPHGSTDSGESSSSSQLPGMHDDIADLENFLLEDMDINADTLPVPDNIGLDGIEAPDDIGALVQGFDTPEELELGSEVELLEMPPASGPPHGQDPTVGRSKGKNVSCPGLDATSSETYCLGSFSDNMRVLSGTMLQSSGEVMDAGDEQIWGVGASSALQTTCSGTTSQQAYGSLVTDPYLMEMMANKPEKFWELDFQALGEEDLQLDKCVINGPALQQKKGNRKL
ncbi:hypothetical protein ABZP36_033021 [Zizania latifolia]